MKRTAVEVDGEVQAVMRPKDPILAMELAQKHIERVNDAAKAGTPWEPAAIKKDFNAILAAQSYRFMGLLGQGRRILDRKTGRSIGKLKRGDAFVHYSEVQKAAALVAKARLLPGVTPSLERIAKTAKSEYGVDLVEDEAPANAPATVNAPTMGTSYRPDKM